MSCCNCWRLVFRKPQIPTVREELRDATDAASIDEEINWAKYDNFVSLCKLKLARENHAFQNDEITVDDNVETKSQTNDVAK